MADENEQPKPKDHTEATNWALAHTSRPGAIGMNGEPLKPGERMKTRHERGQRGGRGGAPGS
jgi:hypothetical protein